MADKIPLKLIEAGSGVGTLAEFATGDSVPVASGGTGGTTQLAAQTALGLVKQTSAGDTTAGSLLLVGAFGQGGNAIAPPSADCNAITVSAAFSMVSAANTPTGADGVLVSQVLSTSYQIQSFTQTSDGKQYSRAKLAGVWQAWDLVVTGQSAVGGFKNRVINGGCQVAQYNTSAAFTTGGYSGCVGYDRWYAINGGGGGSFSQQRSSFTYGGVVKNACAQVVVSLVTDLSTTKYWSGFQHRFEGLNVYDLLGKPVVISFLFAASVAGTYSVAMVDGSQANSYVTTIVAPGGGTVVKYSITLPAFPTTLGIPNTTGAGIYLYIGAQNAGTYLTSTLNAWQSGVKITAASAVTWGLTASATIWCSELQLEVGVIATPFEIRPIPVELSLCYRYFYVMPGGQSLAIATATASSSTGNAVVPGIFRAVPTVTTFVTDANYVVGTPTGNQWTSLISGIAFASRTGTISVGWQPTANSESVFLTLTGQTWNVNPNVALSGPTCTTTFNAEL